MAKSTSIPGYKPGNLRGFASSEGKGSVFTPPPEHDRPVRLCRVGCEAAVVATGTATKIIKTGDRISCNGDDGVVKIIERN